MATLPPSALLKQVEHAARCAGYIPVRTSGAAAMPAQMVLNGPGPTTLRVLVYVKNLTPAHRTNSDEYRIQLSSRVLPLQFLRNTTTVVLGFHAESGLFVGFDPRGVSTTAATQLSAGYVSLSAVRRAKRQGMTFDRNRVGRIAVGMRPELFVAYCQNAAAFHSVDEDVEIVALLNGAAAAYTGTRRLPLAPEEEPGTTRQRLVRTVQILSRDAGFRRRVLDAYEDRCAVSETQLALVEAAHILPVSVEGSNDSVSNGLALLPQYHRAFDAGLIYLTPRYVMRVNERRVEQLRRQRLVDGLDDFEAGMGAIRLPGRRREWPSPALIRQANRVRGVAG